MPLHFDKQAQKGNRFINELSKALGNNTSKAEAGKVLRAVFWTLRDYLS